MTFFLADPAQPGNIVVIGVVAGGYYVYTRQQQGKPVVSGKKTN